MSGVTGDADLGRLGHRLRTAGRKDLIRELRRGAEQGVKPLSAAIIEGIPAHMPAGYEVTLAEAMHFTTSVRTTGRSAAVEHVSVGRGKRGKRGKRREIRALEKGILRHPVHGRHRRVKAGYLIKNPWVRQTIVRGFWSTAVAQNEDDVRKEMRDAIRRVGQKITRG